MDPFITVKNLPCALLIISLLSLSSSQTPLTSNTCKRLFNELWEVCCSSHSSLILISFFHHDALGFYIFPPPTLGCMLLYTAYYVLVYNEWFSMPWREFPSSFPVSFLSFVKSSLNAYFCKNNIMKSHLSKICSFLCSYTFMSTF